MKLFVGLGNVGTKYTATRHNIGFVALDRLRKEWDATDFTEQKKFFAFVSTMSGRNKTILAKPTTMMNASGRCVAALASYYKIFPEGIWVLHDELDLPVGTVRHSFNSRAAGHNGVQSIINSLGTQGFHRIRIGIGRPNDATLVDDFVLRKLPSTDKKKIDSVLAKYLPAFLE